MNRPKGESIWGNINTCVEIALNIYEIVAEHGEGIMVKKGADTPLSDKALLLGTDTGEYIMFDEQTKDIPRYEVLKARLEENKALELELLQEIKEIERDGKYRYPQYFGEIATPDNVVNEICRGIFMVSSDKGNCLAVHKNIAEDYMTEFAATSGMPQDEYLLYDLKTACMPIFELAKIFDEVDAMVIAKESLYATLQTNFTAYTEEYNEIAPQDPIPTVQAPINLYLAEQLSEAQSNIIYVQTPQQEENFEYGEEVNDYGFEP